MTYAQAAPMAATQVGNTMVVGQDLNRDGIPDVLEQPQMVYAQAPQMVEYVQAAPQYTYAQPQMTYAAQAPIAATQVGNTMVVGQDLNRDGIPDVLEQPQMVYAQAPQMAEYVQAAPQMMTYAQPQYAQAPMA